MRIKVKVITNSSQQKVEYINDEALYRVWTRKKAIDDKANESVRDILEDYFGKKTSIIIGKRSKLKIFNVED
mgnify:CR=1 FL=1